MIGLLYLLAFAVYLAIAIVVVFAVVRWAKRTGRSPKKWGWGAAIGMYLVVFWDHLPTVVAHKVLCELKPGTYIHITAEQWARAHANEPAPLPRVGGNYFLKDGSGRSVVQMNSRFGLRNIATRIWPLSTQVVREQVIDLQGEAVLAELVWVRSGYGSLGNSRDWRAMKVWLSLKECTAPGKDFYQEVDHFRRLAATSLK